jgi:hypothetical protein
MRDVVLITRFFFTTAAVLCYPMVAAAQMGMGSLSGMGAGAYPTWHYSNDPLSSGFPGASYTPFERLRAETRISRKPVLQTAEPTGGADGAAARKPAAEEMVTDEVNVYETAFRVRTTRVYPQPSLAVATHTLQPIYLSGDSARERRIRKKLEEPAEKMEFTETPLRDVVAEIEDLHEIPVQIDAKACEDAGLALDAPITWSVRDVSLRSALRLLLGDLDLTHLVTNDVLMITTQDKAAESLPVVLYPVTGDYAPASLIDIVQHTIAPTTWNAVGGPGAIQRAGRFLCVSQAEEVHCEIKHFLERLCEREFLQSDGTEAAMTQRIVTRIHPVADPELIGDLGSKLAGICNAALGSDGDSSARVTVVGDRLIVQSSSRAFHVYAQDVITAFNGVEVTTVESMESRCPTHRLSKKLGVLGMGGVPEGAGGGAF